MSDRPTHRINIEIPEQTLTDLMTTAVESGALAYWGKVSAVERAEDLRVTKFKITEHEEHEPGANRVNRYLTAGDMAQGIERLAVATFPSAPSHFAAALHDHDADTADVVVQMAIFHKIIYG